MCANRLLADFYLFFKLIIGKKKKYNVQNANKYANQLQI